LGSHVQPAEKGEKKGKVEIYQKRNQIGYRYRTYPKEGVTILKVLCGKLVGQVSRGGRFPEKVARRTKRAP